MKAKVPELTSGAELADLLGIGERHLRKLAAKGVVVRAPEGGYEVATSVRNFMTAAQEDARRRRGSGAEEALREARITAIERKLAREDRALMATDEAVDGIDMTIGIFSDALDDLAVRLAPFDLPNTAPVLDEIRGELCKKRDDAVRKLTQG